MADKITFDDHYIATLVTSYAALGDLIDTQGKAVSRDDSALKNVHLGTADFKAGVAMKNAVAAAAGELVTRLKHYRDYAYDVSDGLDGMGKKFTNVEELNAKSAAEWASYFTTT